ncbi:MAG: DUF1501 domain-containing protein, partial [Planctomycetaceae bacterium]|nr:DUF1501 domain-containing protein [Planctomycetaceae bacterium]
MACANTKLSRRQFFQAGGLSVGALSPLGISLADVLAAESTALGTNKKNINVIFMFLQGGASHLDMYDLKPEAQREIRGP